MKIILLQVRQYGTNVSYGAVFLNGEVLSSSSNSADAAEIIANIKQSDFGLEISTIAKNANEHTDREYMNMFSAKHFLFSLHLCIESSIENDGIMPPEFEYLDTSYSTDEIIQFISEEKHKEYSEKL